VSFPAASKSLKCNAVVYSVGLITQGWFKSTPANST
jgi:hypothetical protein